MSRDEVEEFMQHAEWHLLFASVADRSRYRCCQDDLDAALLLREKRHALDAPAFASIPGMSVTDDTATWTCLGKS